MKKILATILCLSLFCKVQAEELPESYRYVQVLPFDGQGWFGNDMPLKKIMHGMPIKTT